MDSLNAIAYNILNKLRGGRSSNNDPYSLDQIKYNIELYRALLIRRDLERNREMTQFEQELSDSTTEIGVEMSMVDLAQEEFIGGINYAYKSVKPIPKPMRLKNQFALNLNGIGRTKVYPVVNYQSIHLAQFNRYTCNDGRAFYLNGYVYIIGDKTTNDMNKFVSGDEEAEVDSTKTIERIVVRGIFEQPRVAMIFNGVSPDKVDDEPYPISYDMIQAITQSLLNGEMQYLTQTENVTELKP